MGLVKNTVLKLLRTVSYYHRTVSIFHQSGKQVVMPGFEVDFNLEEKTFLKACAQSFNYEIDYSCGYRQKEISLTSLKQVTVLGNSGAIVLNGKIVTESTFDMRRLALSPAWRQPAFMVSKTKKGLYTSIFHFPWAETSNYHWFFDCLPRLYALTQQIKESVRLIMPENAPAFQKESLHFVLKDFPNFRIAFIGKHEKWQCERYVFASFVGNHVSGFLPRPVSHFLREKLVPGYKIELNKSFRKIYISRSKSTKRRVRNEAEILPILAKHNIEVVFPEELSYRDQVALFSESTLIIGPHGAGFTNIFFSQQATVLELHPGKALKPHYFLLSKGLGLNYQYLVGSPADEKLDFEISVSEFENKLQEIINAEIN